MPVAFSLLPQGTTSFRRRHTHSGDAMRARDPTATTGSSTPEESDRSSTMRGGDCPTSKPLAIASPSSLSGRRWTHCGGGSLWRRPMELVDEAFRRRVSVAKKGAARLQVVRAAPLEEPGRDYEAPVRPKTQEEMEFLHGCLGESFLFEKLGSNEKRMLVGAFEKYSVASGEAIIAQGEVGDYFYVIDEGEVKYELEGAKKGMAGRGLAFGELSLLYDCPRAATVTALTACKLWRVDRATYWRVVTACHIKCDSETRELLRKVGFLKDLDDHTLTKIAHVMGTRDVKRGEHVVRKGEKYCRFVLVKSGKLLATGGEVDGKKLDDKEFLPGEHFGAIAMLKGLNITGNIVAVEDSIVLYLEKADFVRMCGSYKETIRKTNVKSVLQTVSIVDRKLDAGTAGQLASITVGMECKEGHVFYREGDNVCPGKYIIHSGEVMVESSSGSTKTLGPPGGFFGEETTSEAVEGTVTSKHTVTVKRDVSLSYLDAWSIQSVLGGNDASRDEIEMEDLERHCIIGAGTFGQVWLVSKKGKKDVFALKSQVKSQLIDGNQAAGVVREKNVMAKLNSDFVIQLVGTFQDDQNIYMLTRLYQGGELWSIMHSEDYDALPERVARFYTGGILEGLTHMHRHDVVYRDLKPENVMLDSNGYTVIVDLGCAKVVRDKTYTFCGTPVYLAPEVILQQGHDKGADHWSWGVVLYEMLCGITPFYDKGIEQLTLFKRIINKNFRFPDDFLSKEAEDLIESVLVVNPVHRLGSFAGAERDIQEHAWFRELDFERLRKKELTPPWWPEVADPLDASNFDNWDHLRGTEQERRPLSVEEQSLFKDF